MCSMRSAAAYEENIFDVTVIMLVLKNLFYEILFIQQ